MKKGRLDQHGAERFGRLNQKKCGTETVNKHCMPELVWAAVCIS